jgi:glycosyltransferase involved in cell wall biosynthesis
LNNTEKNDSKERGIRLLILSYHYLPLNVIASYRPKGFADHLCKNGIYPTIITHRWEKDKLGHWKFHKSKKDVIIEKTEKAEIIRLPRKRTTQGRIYHFFSRFYLTRQFIIAFRWINGFLDPGVQNIDSYLIFKAFLFRHLQNSNYDLVMGIFSPHHHLRLCFEINKKFGLPYVLDFRDLWDNSATNTNYSPVGIERLRVSQIMRFWSKWLDKSLFFTTLSEPWKRKINEISNSKGYLILHGYDDDFSNVYNLPGSRKEFIVLYSGSVYENQDMIGFLKGVSEFIKKVLPEKFLFVLLGSDGYSATVKRGLTDSISAILSKKLRPSNYLLTKRVSREDVLEWYRKASIFVSLTYNDFPGTYGGKLFEYLGTGKPILVYNDEKSIISKTVSSINAGFICRNPSEICVVLSNAYTDWKENKIKKIGRKIEYSRFHQTKLLSEHIRRHL